MWCADKVVHELGVRGCSRTCFEWHTYLVGHVPLLLSDSGSEMLHASYFLLWQLQRRRVCKTPSPS